VAGRYFNGGPMGIREGCNTLTVSGVTAHPPLPGISGQEKRLVHYFNLYPNFLFSLAPDYVMAHYLWPPGAGVRLHRNRVVLRAGADGAPGFRRRRRHRLLG